MPAENPTPITPEAKRAADRIRTIFFAIAVANILLVAIVLWQRQAHKPHTDTPAAPAVTGRAPDSHSASKDNGHPERSEVK